MMHADSVSRGTGFQPVDRDAQRPTTGSAWKNHVRPWRHFLSSKRRNASAPSVGVSTYLPVAGHEASLDTGWKPVPRECAFFWVFVLLLSGSVLRAQATQTSSRQLVVLPATVEAYEVADMYAKTSGYVSDVNSDIGDHVKAGQVLAVIDEPELEKDLNEAQALLEARRKMRDAAEAGVVQAQKLREVAKQQLNRYKADLQFQEVTLKRQQELFAGKAITDQQLDDIRARTEVARADAGVAEAKIAGAEADLKGAEASRGVAAAQIEVAAAQVEKIKTLIQYTRIVAPFDGVVTRRLVNRGDLAQAATTGRTSPLFTVQRLDTVRVSCDVPEANVQQVHVGDSAQVKLFTAPLQPIDAHVTRSSFALNPSTRTMRVEIHLKNPQEKLLPGMYAQVTFGVGH
jgi:multidrug efflux pump subunit AcrA (membrane-fusion protein)